MYDEAIMIDKNTIIIIGSNIRDAINSKIKVDVSSAQDEMDHKRFVREVMELDRQLQEAISPIPSFDIDNLRYNAPHHINDWRGNGKRKNKFN